MKRFELFFMVLQVPVDFIGLILAAVCAYLLRFTEWAERLRPVMFDMALAEFLSRIFFVVIFWLVVFAFAGLYAPRPHRRFANDINRIIIASSAVIGVVAVYLLFTQQSFDSRFLIASSWILAVFFVILGRLIMRGLKGILYRMGLGLRRVAVIGNDSIATELIGVFERRPELGYHVVKQYDTFNVETRNALSAEPLDEIIMTNPRAHERDTLRALEFANQRHIGFKYSADLFATLSANMSIHPLAGVPIIEIKKTRLEGWGRVVKRLFDVVFSLLVIIVLSPVMVIVACVILIETGRPVIYKNERVGVRSRHFFTFKFRSMHQKDSTGVQFGTEGKKAEQREKNLIAKQNSKQGPIYKIANDPRITPFGRFLRRSSIDEIPQFFNVLHGEMSIVGPRPHQPREVEGYAKEHTVVFAIKPGITGLAQISGRSDLSFEDEMRLDALYIEKWSLWLDMIISIKTPFILFKKRKAL